MFFVEKNMNPWGKMIGDCAIRAVSSAIAMKYPAVCRLVGKECRPGRRLVGNEGIGLEAIKKRLGNFFDRIEDASETSWENRPEEFRDMEFDPEIDSDPDLGLTLDQFCESYRDTGRYLVALVHGSKPKDGTSRIRDGHVIYANLSPGKNYFFDTLDCGKMIVYAYMRVVAILDVNSPQSLYYKKK